jgi:hypothetical protein
MILRILGNFVSLAGEAEMARIAGAHQGPGGSLAHSYLFSKPFQLGMTESTSDSKQVMERSMMVIISLCSRFPIFG